jgi:hypothetical protein
MGNWGWREKQSLLKRSEQSMTLKQSISNKNIDISLQKIRAEELDVEHRFKILLTEVEALLNSLQSDFPWR